MADGENHVHSGTTHRSAEPDAGHAASTGQQDNAAAGNALTGSRFNTPRPSPAPAPSQDQPSADLTAQAGDWDWEVLQKYPALSHIAKQFIKFVSKKDLERFEADARTCLPPARYDSLAEFLAILKNWLAGGGSPSPLKDARVFFEREIAAAAVQARAEALEVQGELL
jgi:hypothetical protein